MARPSTATVSYNSTAKILHWLIALAIIGMLALGWIMTSLPKGDALKFPLFQWHKSIGITILVLSLFRLMWRLRHRAPPMPVTMAKWEKAAAYAGHFCLYTLMIAMPFSGWIIVSSSSMNIPTMLYGLVAWPNFPVEDFGDKQAIGHAAGTFHYYAAYIFAALIAGHIGAAWKHHLFNRDDVLTRMAPKAFAGFLNCLRGMS